MRKENRHNKLLKTQIRCILKKSGEGIGSALWILQKKFPVLKVSPCFPVSTQQESQLINIYQLSADQLIQRDQNAEYYPCPV